MWSIFPSAFGLTQCEYNIPLEIGPCFEFFFDDFPRDIT